MLLLTKDYRLPSSKMGLFNVFLAIDWLSARAKYCHLNSCYFYIFIELTIVFDLLFWEKIYYFKEQFCSIDIFYLLHSFYHFFFYFKVKTLKSSMFWNWNRYFWLRFFIKYQKSLKQTFKTGFWVQNHFEFVFSCCDSTELIL